MLLSVCLLQGRGCVIEVELLLCVFVSIRGKVTVRKRHGREGGGGEREGGRE